MQNHNRECLAHLNICLMTDAQRLGVAESAEVIKAALLYLFLQNATRTPLDNAQNKRRHEHRQRHQHQLRIRF